MTTKKYDLAVKVGSYKDRDGNEKGRYQNIGAVLENDKGQFMMLARWFNPAAIGEGESVLVSMFEPKQRDGGQSGGGRPSNNDLDADSIPFSPEWRV